MPKISKRTIHIRWNYKTAHNESAETGYEGMIKLQITCLPATRFSLNHSTNRLIYSPKRWKGDRLEAERDERLSAPEISF